MSKYEEQIAKVLQKEGLTFEREKTFEDLKHGKLRYDFYIPSLNIIAIDKSKEALKVAIENSKLNNVNVDFQNQDIFNYELPENISIVISNPPYIEEDSNYSQNVLYEPKEAIFVSNINPLIYYEQILKIAKEQINKKHLIAFEIDEDHKEDMHKLCKKYFPSDNIVIEKDLAGKNRYAFIYSE